MTIEIRGHIQAIENAGAGHVLLTVQIEASRMPAGHLGKAPIINVYASAAETDSYRVGMPIYILMWPDLARSGCGKHGE